MLKAHLFFSFYDAVSVKKFSHYFTCTMTIERKLHLEEKREIRARTWRGRDELQSERRNFKEEWEGKQSLG